MVARRRACTRRCNGFQRGGACLVVAVSLCICEIDDRSIAAAQHYDGPVVGLPQPMLQNRRCGTCCGANDTDSPMCIGSTSDGRLTALTEAQVAARCKLDSSCAGFGQIDAADGGYFRPVTKIDAIDTTYTTWHTWRKHSGPAPPPAPPAPPRPPPPPPPPLPGPRPHQPLERPVLLFSYFLLSSMSLHLAWSRDGLNFTDLNGGYPVLCAPKGNWSTLRDPYMQRGPDNQTFHIVTSAGDFGPADRFHYWNLTLASGLPVFSVGTTPRVMEPIPKAKCVWAPEWRYHPAKRQYLVFWASTMSDDVNNGAKTIWGRWTPDFSSWPEKPFVLLDPGYDAIDADAMVLPNGTALLFFKDERGNCCHRDPLCPETNSSCPRRYYKTIRRASATYGLQDRFLSTSVTAGFSPQLTEGPEIVDWPPNPTGQRYLLYYDCFMDNHYGISSSDDLQTFREVEGSSCTDYGPYITMPKGNFTKDGPRHGSFTPISETELHILQKAYPNRRSAPWHDPSLAC
eukprot:COSAG02_NODE_2288_length_9212_cov_11.304071_3_plen_513_part_00